MTGEQRPLRRSDLDVRSIGDELTIFDASTGHFHALDAVSTRIWHRLDGVHSPSEIARSLNTPPEIIEYAVSELADRGLLTGGPSATRKTRRDMVRMLSAAGLLGVVAIPTVGSITGASSALADLSCLPAQSVCSTTDGSECVTSCCPGIGFVFNNDTPRTYFCGCIPSGQSCEVLVTTCVGCCQPAGEFESTCP